jgi:hypothetical protein
MNAAIRSVVRVSTQLGLNVYIVKEGYYGLITGEDYIVKANWFDVSSILSLVCMIPKHQAIIFYCSVMIFALQGWHFYWNQTVYGVYD